MVLVPARGRRERRAVVGRCHEDRTAEFETARELAELLSALHEIPKDEAAAGMRHDVERRRLLRQTLEQHPDVLLRRSAEAEMVECENAVVVHVLHTSEERRSRPVCEKRRRRSKTCRG